MNRFRGVLFLFAMILSGSGAFAQASGTVKLEEPVKAFHMDLMQAFQARHSTKSYQTTEISAVDLGTVLWAANGVNRENGKRTAPAPKGNHLVQIYVLSNKGIFLYEPKNHALKPISEKNLKAKVAIQPYVGEASHVLALVADLSLFPGKDVKELVQAWGQATAGCIAQNIYLAAAGLKLGTCMVASMNLEEVKTALSLSDQQIPLYLMPLGVPKE